MITRNKIYFTCHWEDSNHYYLNIKNKLSGIWKILKQHLTMKKLNI